ncbi:MAG: type IX secretion system PorP/SprF family membrane protein [Saprospiraceae bacterium]|jgi:type IX secretion system PorP/SprF family membrane protein
MMKKCTLAILIVFMASAWSFAQQDAMFTKYMFNSLAYNPAFAGSPEYLSVRLLYRDQWLGLEGAPTSQTFTIHSPVSERIGLGLGIVNDKIGATGSTTTNISYAYRIPFGKGKVSMGLQTGFSNWRADWNELKFRDPAAIDNSFMEMTPSYWMFNFGAGVFYYAPKYYVGISLPHLFNNDLRRDVGGEVEIWAQQYRHFYFSAGAAIPIKGDAMIFKPSILIKSVGLFGDFTPASSNPSKVGAPTEFDLDASVLFYNTLWLGVSIRGAFEAKTFGGNSSFDSADIWVAYYLMSGIRVGAAYDYSINKLGDYNKGSFELMLGYDFNYNSQSFNTPRYF